MKAWKVAILIWSAYLLSCAAVHAQTEDSLRAKLDSLEHVRNRVQARLLQLDKEGMPLPRLRLVRPLRSNRTKKEKY